MAENNTKQFTYFLLTGQKDKAQSCLRAGITVDQIDCLLKEEIKKYIVPNWHVVIDPFLSALEKGDEEMAKQYLFGNESIQNRLDRVLHDLYDKKELYLKDRDLIKRLYKLGADNVMAMNAPLSNSFFAQQFIDFMMNDDVENAGALLCDGMSVEKVKTAIYQLIDDRVQKPEENYKEWMREFIARQMDLPEDTEISSADKTMSMKAMECFLDKALEYADKYEALNYFYDVMSLFAWTRNLYVKLGNGYNILHVAASLGVYEDIEVLERRRSMVSLLNDQDHEGNTPFHIAIQKRSLRTLCRFFDVFQSDQIDLTIKNKEGLDALALAKAEWQERKKIKEEVRSMIAYSGMKKPQYHCKEEEAAKRIYKLIKSKVYSKPSLFKKMVLR